MKLDKSSFVSEKIPVEVPNGDKKLTLYVRELGYLEVTKAYSEQENILPRLIVAAVTDENGERFTLEEVLSLKKEVADPLIEAVLKVNSSGREEKN